MVSFHNFSVTPLHHILQRLMRLCRPLCLAVPLWAASTGLVSAESWKVNLQDADIKAFINEVATITDQNFVLDPRINGNVTVISNKALSRDEIFQLFLSVMQVNGIAAIDSGTTIKLVPDNVAKQSGVAVDLRGDSVGEALATRVIYLTNTQAAEVLGVIRPLMPQSAHAAAVPGVNALVLSDRADSLNQLTALIRDLDSNVNDSLQVIPLRHVDAERMMELISALVASAGSGQAQGGSNQLKVIADTSSDRLLVKGSPEMIAKVTEMVNQLDTTPTRRLSGLRVFRLKYASAGHIAEMLRGLLASQSINSSGATSTLESASLNDASSTGSTLNSGAIASNGNTGNSGAAALSTTGSSGTGTGIGGRPFSIIADETQNAVIVNAAPELMFEIEDAVNQLDSRRAQVLIQAAIVEVSGDDATQLGVQWALGNANSGYGVVNFNNVGASAVSLAAAALSGGAGISAAAGSIAGALIGIGDSKKDSQGNTQFYGAILQALDSSTSANLLSMPSILTLDNEKASILVGQNVPFVTGSYTTGGDSSTNPFQTIERKDIGINLNVIPHIGDNGTVRLEVSQEVSSVVPGSAGNASGLITNKSLINTTILADDQQTIALGGLMRDNTTTRQQKVPGLGNVPLLGRLFRSDNDTTQKSNLIIFLQPTILRDGGAVASVTERKYNQMRVLQLVIDKNGTIKQLPLSGTEGWNGNVGADYELMPLNPLVPKRDQTPKTTSQGFTKVESPSSSGITTYPLNR
ncbi:type II secretion system secretin GspD [Psychrobacter sp. ANT_WB68]|uniref:type II secretion system secretin GspD n=1 Tax=Psychrobacter sp. ANT_WB68 TaxID=2597355 RepID=UPI0011F0AF76|nr:type II secretion system secretin GspD [Psychrobacter sp. ANT_WB68]KAA0915215.1 type II secretion system protein GspD [Psychrobacter sp. ANT_WB68]